MSWTSLDGDEATCESCDEEEEEDSVEGETGEQNDGKIKRKSNTFGLGDGPQTKQQFAYSHLLSKEQLGLCNPIVQEPNSDNEIHSQKNQSLSQDEVKILLGSKDEHIRNLQKLINGQREQLYHFLKLSLKEETILELKKTCRETEGTNFDENISMALDKFKYENNIPTQQTMVRENISKILIKIEKLIRHQTKVVKNLESGNLVCSEFKDAEESAEMSCYEYQLTNNRKLSKGTKQIERKLAMLKIELKKLSLIEQERIDLVERVYSMPSDQRRYYGHLVIIERDKNEIQLETEKLSENYRDLKRKCCFLEETEQELNECIDSKIAALDLNKIKPGLETHLELMEMVERGELSLVTMTKDEKGRLNGDFVNIYNDNAEMSERLKDFDKVTQERNYLKREIEVLVDNCFRLQSEVKALRLASRTDDLLEQLRLACLEREQLKTKLELFLRKNGSTISGVLNFFNNHNRGREIVGEGGEEDVESLRVKARQSESYRVEVERLKAVVNELEAAKAESVNRNVENTAKSVCVLDRNLAKQLERTKELEEQRERLVLEISRYRFALLRQEEEIKELVTIVDKLTEQMEKLKINTIVNHAEGIPEGPDINPMINSEDKKRLDIIRKRIIHEDNSESDKSSKYENHPIKHFPGKNSIVTSVKNFLGLDNSPKKTID